MGIFSNQVERKEKYQNIFWGLFAFDFDQVSIEVSFSFQRVPCADPQNFPGGPRDILVCFGGGTFLPISTYVLTSGIRGAWY